MNRLGNEKSPYLLQHAHNPVDWYPWGPEAFEKARAENKPIFLSIGYSTCHWCHVMERESFENEQIAGLLNRDYVPIKVDREERPDVDRIYMTFVQATTGGGGWPMSVWLTPDLQPFFGGTYFPPREPLGAAGVRLRPGPDLGCVAQRPRRRSWTRRATWWRSFRSRPRWNRGAEASIDDAACSTAASSSSAAPSIRTWAASAARPSSRGPRSTTFCCATTRARRIEEALDMVLLTLREMAKGGMHDQLGGGFHRYSVDERWFVPHFEKMLYDQAQLAISYLEAFQITGDPQYAETARGIFDYVLRDMTDSEGGFYSAEDADSVDRPGGAGRKGRRSVLHLDARKRFAGWCRAARRRLVLLPLRGGGERQRGQRSAQRIRRQEHPLPRRHHRGDGRAFDRPGGRNPRGTAARRTRFCWRRGRSACGRTSTTRCSPRGTAS